VTLKAQPFSLLLGVERAAALCASIAVLGMMLVGALDVIGTAGFNRPVPGAYELTEVLMVASVFLALALSQREGRQIRVTLLAERLPPRGRAVLDVFAELFSVLVYAVIAWYGWGMAAESWHAGELSSGLLRFPLWPSKLALGLGASLMTIQCVAGAFSALRRAV
jgi:TRAP-type C4-dicarboxylate transport system permease small subunit